MEIETIPVKKTPVAVTARIKTWVKENVNTPMTGFGELTNRDPLKATQSQFRKIARRHLSRGESEDQVIKFLQEVNSGS